MRVHLNGKAMTDRTTAHTHLAEVLDLPEYYGRNLDALYDLLMEISGEKEIVLHDPAAVMEQLGKYGEALLSTLQEAAEENPHLIITLE